MADKYDRSVLEKMLQDHGIAFDYTMAGDLRLATTEGRYVAIGTGYDHSSFTLFFSTSDISDIENFLFGEEG